MDLKSRERWVDYSKAKDEMLNYTDTKLSPWYVVNADDKKKARLNTMHHLLSKIPYGDLDLPEITLKERKPEKGYVRPPMQEQTFIPDLYKIQKDS
jgi:hypothetical protein